MTTGCTHPGAPACCPLCTMGAGFTGQGQSALDAIADLSGSERVTDCYPSAADDLAYARDCVIGREWDMAWQRLRQRNIDEDRICGTTGLVSSACRCAKHARPGGRRR